ncbi:MAG: hypothetical protein M3276_00610 [Actinomycetota bacterium]|nr:hypothetical protein [Actinomycetota bacterium]
MTLEPVGEAVEQAATSTSKSAVLRRFVAATAERLAALCCRPLDQQRWLIVFIDGFGLGEHTMVGALGSRPTHILCPPGRGGGPHREHRGVPRLWPTSPSAAWTPPVG